MRHHPVVCFREDTAEVAARTMAEQKAGVLPVVRKGSGGRLIGMVTDRDICLRVVAEGRDPKLVTVAECMTSTPIACGPRDDVQYAMMLMREHQVRRIPIVDAEGRVGGVLCFSNLVNAQCDPDSLVDTLRLTCYPVTRSLAVTKA
ncbi:MAG TPA: CBS domain-containing protein [Terriglobales bacterium]|nr:CBS domain-containing protein [Terriglobales bacterium]